MTSLACHHPTGTCLGAPFSADVGSCSKMSVGRVAHVQDLASGASFRCEGLRSYGGALGSRRSHQCRALVEDRKVTGITFAQPPQVEYFPEEENLGFLQRLVRAWQILFPAKRKTSTNAAVAKQRLKMILISDRCSVNDAAKRRIVTNIVGALADFVEIESEDKVQLNVSTDPDLGTVYSVTIPVRRVKPEYQEYSKEMQEFEGIQYDDENVFGEMRTLDIRFENRDSSETEAE